MTRPGQIRLPDNPDESLTVPLDSASELADSVHLLGVKEIRAINGALTAGRPLLVRGEPGVGKSQLARAAARELGRPYIRLVVDSATESRDLMWSFDAVTRLADAQIAGALGLTRDELRHELAVSRYVQPGPLWWAFDWGSAARQSDDAKVAPAPRPEGGDPAAGCVFLLDEIDKAESEVPNGLLEVLGTREFTPFGLGHAVKITGPAPLIVITTNEERALPDAFLRRCLVLTLRLPDTEAELIAFLVRRGQAHFPGIGDPVQRAAARMLHEDRRAAHENNIRPGPGQAEFLDLLRIVRSQANERKQMEMLEFVRGFTLRKYLGSD